MLGSPTSSTSPRPTGKADSPPNVGPADRGARSWPAVAVLTLVVLAGLAAYRFFRLALYPIYKGEGGGDFAFYQEAARLYLSGSTLYPDPGANGTYLYPPPFALALTPLAYLPGAYFVFISLMAAAVALTVYLLSRFAQQDRSALAALLGILALAAWPVHLLLRQGQVESLTLVLMVGSLVLAWKGRLRWAAVALGVAISIKLTPAVLSLYFVWKRRYRLGIESLAVAGAIVLASGFFVGFGDIFTYATRVLPRLAGEGNWYWYNQSLHAVFLRLFTPTRYTEPLADLGMGAVALASGTAGLVLLVVILVCVQRDWPTRPPLYLAEAGAFILLEVLTAVTSWHMHAVWLLVPVGGLTLWVLEDRSVPRWAMLAVGIGALGFLSGPYEPPFEYGRFERGWATLLISHTVAADLLLLVLCLYVSRRAVVAARRRFAESTQAAPVAEPAKATTSCG